MSIATVQPYLVANREMTTDRRNSSQEREAHLNSKHLRLTVGKFAKPGPPLRPSRFCNTRTCGQYCRDYEYEYCTSTRTVVAILHFVPRSRVVEFSEPGPRKFAQPGPRRYEYVLVLLTSSSSSAAYCTSTGHMAYLCPNFAEPVHLTHHGQLTPRACHCDNTEQHAITMRCMLAVQAEFT